ncbi:hypothetical protein FB451DRAFT_1162494 [Mycena latifolia]|nr:hypothetical protein FB451DRAFT_1162494 [Mycena latifolia]
MDAKPLVPGLGGIMRIRWRREDTKGVPRVNEDQCRGGVRFVSDSQRATEVVQVFVGRLTQEKTRRQSSMTEFWPSLISLTYFFNLSSGILPPLSSSYVGNIARNPTLLATRASVAAGVEHVLIYGGEELGASLSRRVGPSKRVFEPRLPRYDARGVEARTSYMSRRSEDTDARRSERRDETITRQLRAVPTADDVHWLVCAAVDFLSIPPSYVPRLILRPRVDNTHDVTQAADINSTPYGVGFPSRSRSHLGAFPGILPYLEQAPHQRFL